MALSEIQPAYKIYAFDRGWRIMKYVTAHLFKRTDVAARWWFNKARDAYIKSKSQGAFVKYWIYVYMGGLYLAGGAQYITAMFLAGLFLAIQSIILTLWAGLSSILIGLLAAATFVYSHIYRIFFRCPECHKEMPIPTFICSSCHERHTRLWPSIYGVFSHRCAGASGTCNTSLPTLSFDLSFLHLMDRDTLERICPHCNHPLNAAIGQSTNIHIPVVGGPNTGKSNYIVTATGVFKAIYEQNYRYTITFPDKKHEQDYTENTRRLGQGLPLVKTTEVVARAYNLKIEAPGAVVPKLAYIYDAAGEAFNTSENTAQQEYYKYIDGIIFIIDPFSIPEYRVTHEVEMRPYQNLIRPSELDVMQAYERMFTMFEDSAGLRKGRRFNHPIAIVISKVDALYLENELGTMSAQNLMSSDPSLTREGDAQSKLTRDFLRRYGLDHFVQNVEMQFSNVRYFSCSALGRMPTPGDMRGFVPLRVEEPLIWLLAKARAIEMPQTLKSGNATRLLKPMTIPIRRK